MAIKNTHEIGLTEVFGAQGVRHGVHTTPHVAPEGEGQLEVLERLRPRLDQQGRPGEL